MSVAAVPAAVGLWLLGCNCARVWIAEGKKNTSWRSRLVSLVWNVEGTASATDGGNATSSPAPTASPNPMAGTKTEHFFHAQVFALRALRTELQYGSSFRQVVVQWTDAYRVGRQHERIDLRALLSLGWLRGPLMIHTGSAEVARHARELLNIPDRRVAGRRARRSVAAQRRVAAERVLAERVEAVVDALSRAGEGERETQSAKYRAQASDPSKRHDTAVDRE